MKIFIFVYLRFKWGADAPCSADPTEVEDIILKVQSILILIMIINSLYCFLVAPIEIIARRVILCDASKWRRHYRRSTGYCSVLPLWSWTTALGAGISRVLPPRVYRPLSALT